MIKVKMKVRISTILNNFAFGGIVPQPKPFQNLIMDHNNIVFHISAYLHCIFYNHLKIIYMYMHVYIYICMYIYIYIYY